MRAVLDVNVLVSAAISFTGAPATIVRRWIDGSFELVVSSSLLNELGMVLRYEKLSRLITHEEADQYLDLVGSAFVMDDPGTDPPVRPADPDDVYLVALAAHARVPIVSGDRHLLDLANRIPVFTPREFVVMLDEA